MTLHSRRNFLRTASVGAAAAGIAVAVPTTAASATPSEGASTGPLHTGPFVAWIKNARSGEISVLVGEHEVVVHDRALATRLASIAATAPHAG